MVSGETLTCEVNECGNIIVVKSRGFCDKHYTRWKRHGDPTHVTRGNTKGLSVEDKLIYYGWNVSQDRGCWEWKGKHPKSRYGKISLRGKDYLAHRAAYEVWVGPIPKGLLVRHTCDNPPCINPEHLKVGTAKDNARDKVLRNRTQDQRGELGPRAKLTQAEVGQIRETYSDGGVTQQALADQYGVTQTTIGLIVRNKTWYEAKH